MLLAPLIGEVFRSFKAKLVKKPDFSSYKGPTMQEYYRNLHDAEEAGYRMGYGIGFTAGAMSKQIHDARADIAKHVGE